MDAIDQFRLAIAAAGLTPPDTINPGQWHRFPGYQKNAKNKAAYCFMFDDMRGGVFGDFSSGMESTWQAENSKPYTAAEREAHRQRIKAIQTRREAEQAVNAQRIETLWAQCVPVGAGDPVTLYLQRRGLCGPVPECLRLHSGLTYWHDGQKMGIFPAMVAPLIGSDGRVLALHRTYLTGDGNKAPVPTVKKLTPGAGTLAGACIRLHDPQGGVIGIAEGVETAQAAWLASGVPTVAAYCSGNLAAYAWPQGLQRIVVFADADLAGAGAAQTLKSRAMRAGLRVAVMTPTTPGLDWCDVWSQREAVTVENAA